MQVIIYTTTTCPYCKMLKTFLGEHNVSYSEKLVDQDDAARDEMMKESGGFLGVPYSIVTTDSGQKEKIIGFDKGKFTEILGIKE